MPKTTATKTIEMDEDTMMVFYDGRWSRPTLREWKFIRMLVNARGSTVTVDEMVDAFWAKSKNKQRSGNARGLADAVRDKIGEDLVKLDYRRGYYTEARLVRKAAR